MTYAPTFGWPLVLALLLLLAIAVAASLARRLGLDRALVVAAGRAVVQLVAVSALIAAVLARTWASLLFTLVMYTVAVGTAAGRAGLALGLRPRRPPPSCSSSSDCWPPSPRSSWCRNG